MAYPPYWPAVYFLSKRAWKWRRASRPPFIRRSVSNDGDLGQPGAGLQAKLVPLPPLKGITAGHLLFPRSTPDAPSTPNSRRVSVLFIMDNGAFYVSPTYPDEFRKLKSARCRCLAAGLHNPQGFLVMFYCLIFLPLLGESVTQAFMGIGKFWLNPQGLAVMPYRLIYLSAGT